MLQDRPLPLLPRFWAPAQPPVPQPAVARGAARHAVLPRPNAPVHLQPQGQPGYLGYGKQYYSLTVGVRGGHAPTGWLGRLSAWSRKCCIRSAWAQEVGGRAERVHFQGVVQLHGINSTAFCKASSLCCLPDAGWGFVK